VREQRNLAERIRQAALTRFVAQGYRGTSIQEIARDVGVSGAALYYHFASKDDLLLAIVRPLVDELTDLSKRVDNLSAEAIIAGYLAVVARHAEVANYIRRDPAVQTHPILGSEAQEASLRVHAALERQLDGPDATLRAACALGAIAGGTYFLDEPTGHHAQLILAAAIAAAGLPPVAP